MRVLNFKKEILEDLMVSQKISQNFFQPTKLIPPNLNFYVSYERRNVFRW